MSRPYDQNDTIAALATPPGTGGVAIIRISGSKAREITSAIFSGDLWSYASHTVHFGKIQDSTGIIDEVLLCPFLAPRSYTGEECIEIHCHGGSLISKKVLEAVLRAGARAAEPGEFTFRAFMNGKIDLAQAEAVEQLISAQNDLALHAANQQLAGSLSLRIQQFQTALLQTAAILEAWIDFPEEGLEFASVEEVIASLCATKQEMEQLANSFSHGRILQEGLSLCLAGPPNAGKSSLMNLLLRRERAIVTEIPGTTRDLLEEPLRMGDLHFRLQDTAGIRDTEELIEKEGIRRSKEAMQESDLVLLLLDAAHPHLDEQSRSLLSQANKERTILVWNKTDLSDGRALPSLLPHTLQISVKREKGIETLKEKIFQLAWGHKIPSKEEITLTNVRHNEALLRSIASLQQVVEGLQEKRSPEFISFDMRRALAELSAIIGMNITEELLSAIFSKFCVGK